MNIFRVQFIIKKSGYKNRKMEGICVFPEGTKKKIPQMKSEAIDFIAVELVKRNPAFETFNIELTIFKRLKTDFMYCPFQEENKDQQNESCTISVP